MALADRVSVALLECRGGRIAWANRALAALAGAGDPDALRGRSPDALVEDAGAGLPDWLGGEVAPAGEPAVECRLRTADGGRRTVRVRPLGSGTWELRDVTPLRALEAEVHQLGAELLEARRELEITRGRLEGEAKEREELLSVVSHELQTPLTVMAGFTRLLLSEEVGPLNAEQRHFLAESARSCRRLSHFIANLTEVDRAGVSAAALSLESALLAPVIEGVAELMRPLLRERAQELHLSLEPELRARLDAARIEQVLINLIGNAHKYGRPGGVIEVTTRSLRAAGRRFAEVSVTDDGPGVPAAERERIFEPYVRAAGVAEAGGLGLGLAIARRIVEAHGGTLGVADAPGGGSRFAFTLCGAEAAP